MAKTYYITREELILLQLLEKLPRYAWICEDYISKVNGSTLEMCACSLKKKTYIISDERGQYRVDKGLGALLRMCCDYTGYFEVKASNGERELLFFLANGIASVSEKADMLELLYIPFLPLAIGHIADTISPFLNTSTENIGQLAEDDYSDIVEGYKSKGYLLNRTFCVKDPDGNVVSECCELTNEKIQLVIYREDGAVKAWKPGKADYVNMLTKMYAPIHAEAIRKGGYLNVEA